jgi:hypothetical protein
VDSAAVIVAGHDGDATDVRIHAYVVTTRPGDTLGIRRRVGEMLPEYMVPSTVTAVTALPLTSNGKLDVAALPSPGTTAPTAVPATEAATTAEATMAADDESAEAGLAGTITQVWRQILGLPAGPGEDFFEQGGNSLLAVRLVTALRDAGLPPVSVRDLYRNRTVDRLSALIESRVPVG